MINQESLAGRVAIVTGAKKGIGLCVSETLASLGATVARADVEFSAQQANANTDTSLRPPHTHHKVDVQSEKSCRNLISEVVETHGRVDYLVNNAGIVQRGSAISMSPDDFTQVLDVNLTGTFRMSIAAYPELVKNQGAVVNLGSTNGHIAVQNTAAYCVSKAGVMHLTRVLALEWAPVGIRVNAVAPTIVATDMTSDVRANDDYMADKISSIPLRRMAEPQEVANSIAFLLSSAASMTTGQTLFIDGGVTIH